MTEMTKQLADSLATGNQLKEIFPEAVPASAYGSADLGIVNNSDSGKSYNASADPVIDCRSCEAITKVIDGQGQAAITASADFTNSGKSAEICRTTTALPGILAQGKAGILARWGMVGNNAEANRGKNYETPHEQNCETPWGLSHNPKARLSHNSVIGLALRLLQELYQHQSYCRKRAPARAASGLSAITVGLYPARRGTE